jgi:hypothetical protein
VSFRVVRGKKFLKILEKFFIFSKAKYICDHIYMHELFNENPSLAEEPCFSFLVRFVRDGAYGYSGNKVRALFTVQGAGGGGTGAEVQFVRQTVDLRD